VTFPEIPLGLVTTCLDGRRVPLNAEQRSEQPGTYPYWGAGSIVDHIDDYIFDEDLVLLGEDGAPFFDPAREVAFFVRERVWVNNHIHVLRPSPDTDPSFLTHALNVVDYNEYITGSTRDKLTQDDMRAIRVPFPELAEQQRIADFVDDQIGRVRQVIDARHAQRKLLEELTTAAMNRAIYSGAFELVPLSAVADIRLGRQRSPDRAEGPNIAPYLRSANVEDGRFRLDDIKLMDFSPSERKIFRLRQGDVLITEGAGSPHAVGASAVWDGSIDELYFQNTLLRIRARPGVSQAQYLGWWSRTAHRSGRMRSWASGANILHLGVDGLRRMTIPKRELLAQSECSERVAELVALEDTLASNFESQIVNLAKWKDSLITAAVTGEFDVSTASRSLVPA
jgi:type I restriction enzyme S subunit